MINSQACHATCLNNYSKMSDFGIPRQPMHARYVHYAALLSTRKTKNIRPGNHLEPIEIKAYPSELELCPVTHIRHYLTQTTPLRQGSRLFFSLLKPYKPVTPATIGRWIKSMLTEAGINTEQYSAHSSWTASSSFALSSGLAIQDILKVGG